jgi:hypothetical protein
MSHCAWRAHGAAEARAKIYARFINIGDGPDLVRLAELGKELIVTVVQ